MDDIDKKIAGLIQENGKISNSDIAQATGVSLSTAHERVKRLQGDGIITGWHARLDPKRVDAGLCVFMMVDMHYEGEEDAISALQSRSEVMEIHHISGPHSYLVKIRVRDPEAAQFFLQTVIKPLKAVKSTESLMVFASIKESSTLPLS